MNTSQPIQPTTASERIDVLDILRGFALLGILAVNMAIFSFPLISQFIGTPRGDGALDRVAEFLVTWLATSKFYPLFAFLFGLGMTLQMERIQAAGGGPARFIVRRLLVLMIFGLIHALLIWNGDVLFIYAITGLVLVLFRNVPPRNLLIWAGVLIAIPVVFNLGSVVLGALSAGASAEGMRVFDDLTQDLERRALETYARGTWGQIFVWRAIEWLITLALFLFNSWLQILALFLIGMYFAKRQIFQHLDEHLPLFRRGLRIGLGVGLPANFVVAWIAHVGERDLASPLFGLWAVLLLVFGPVLTFGYISAFVLLARQAAWHKRFAPLAAAGRMALSNYIMQSVVCTLIFYSYGLGLFGQVGAFAGLLLSVAIWLIQLPVSVAWLSRFRFGPLEWLWRTLTYGKAQPILKSSAPSPALP
ncbi:MAG: DUF418 domain-containing protein [Anaerolineae bacterium]|nr:DUF418 domain-containing protein [Candidatus Roseilinea sp.]MDW8450812.1 DUF418 domain-containing protein [Anaerolineae bacterium]